ncbi:two-component regulator propeller domain-containing protein [Spongiivirga sp. MCCC 1A20706]|uniref:two-component regulator propeller domain-containing protein n=1 Tax=Spongiivirga sp. MCCC 1A20706 TaxID=3160963 RepID=UPI0039779C68
MYSKRIFFGRQGISFFLCWVVLLTCLKISGQEQITFRQLSVKNGLSQNSVVSISQDNTGHLWIATQDGLNKYDGKRFTQFPFQFTDITQPGHSSLGKIYIDKQDHVWIIPDDRKVYKSAPNGSAFKLFGKVENAYTFYQDSNDNYWVGTTDGLLYFIDQKSEEVSTIVIDSISNQTIYHIDSYNQQPDSIVLTYENQLATIDINTKKVNRLQLKIDDNTTVKRNFSALATDNTNGIWVGTFGDGLYYLTSNKQLSRPFIKGNWIDIPNNLNILDIYNDSKNRLWIATYGNGLLMLDFNQERTHHFQPQKTNPRAIHYKDILCIYEDYLGTIWFGTDGAGLSYYDENLEKFNSFTNYQTPENVSIDVVRSIAVSPENIWIGTSGKGLTSYNAKVDSWKTYATNNSKITSDRIMSLLLDHENELLIGTQGSGLCLLDSSGNFIDYSNYVSANTIWDIFQENDTTIWISTQSSGLIKFDKQNKKQTVYKTPIKVDGELKQPSIRVIEKDLEDNFWLGTDQHGLLKFHPKTGNTENINSEDLKSIKSLFYDPSGKLWIGTNGNGLIQYNEKSASFKKYTIENGLPNNVIYAILPDTQNNLWLSSNKGITKFTSTNTTPVITNYANYDGLATEFNTGAYFKNKDGSLYFGGLDGFYWFDPNEIRNTAILPKTIITGMQVLDQEYPLAENLKLDSNKNTVAFTFSSMQFSLPEKNSYQYRLVNYDNDWIQAGHNNFVRYSQLPAGDYTFQVKSSNYDGVWNDDAESFSFTIKAPWYLTIVAKLAYALLAIVLVFTIYRYLKWRWMMQLSLKMKEEEALKFKNLNQLKSKLYTDIAHEFKTPLTLISAPLEDKLREPSLSQKDHSNMTMVTRNVSRLSDLVDQLLALAKLDDGKQKVKLETDDLGLFLHAISESFEYRAQQKHISFSKVINVRGQISYDADIIEKVLTNLLSNAMKYTPERGSCIFNANHTHNRLQLLVKNETSNPDQLELEKLFNRFYQVDSHSDGAGIGLSLVKELVKLYKGTIEVFFDDDQKICFKVEIPATLESPKSHIQEEVDDTLVTVNSTSNFFGPVNIENSDLPILLVAEDHHEVRKFVVKTFKDTYTVIDAANGKVALEKALEFVPDIILSDIQMPFMNGIELCNTIKTDPRTSHIPIILLTAGFDEEVELKGLISGADDYVTKPFKLAVLEQRIANLINVRKKLKERYQQELILKPKDIQITSADELFLNDIQQVLDEHLTNPEFTAEKFSEYAHMSRMQLHRKLVAFTGLSTSAFIRSQRLKMAKELLEKTNQTVSEIGYEVGFSTPSYFMKCFKDTFKKTPTEYINSLKR